MEIQFIDMIKQILSLGKLKKQYIDVLLSDNNIKLYKQAFVHKKDNEMFNYEIFEQKGDISINKFLVWYMYDRFPELNNNPEGVKIVAMLRVKYGSKDVLSNLSKSLGFNKFIIATKIKPTEIESVNEDVFEAFIGATEYIIDTHTRIGVGYAIVYEILKNIFDFINISINPDDLIDPKTRLKELSDKHKLDFQYKHQQIRVNDNKIGFIVSIFINDNGISTQISTAQGTTKIQTQQLAAELALKNPKMLKFQTKGL